MYRVGRARLEEGRARRLNWWEFDTPKKREESNPNSGRWFFNHRAPYCLCILYYWTYQPLFLKKIFSYSGIHFEVFIFHSNFIFLYFSIDSLSLLPRVKKELEKVVGLFQCRLLWIVWGPAGMTPPLSTWEPRERKNKKKMKISSISGRAACPWPQPPPRWN